MSTPERPGLDPDELKRRKFAVATFLIVYAAIWIVIGFLLALVVE